MDRYIHSQTIKDLKKKMVFVTGPRQVGKTYFAKSLQTAFKSPVYLNNDDVSDMEVIRARAWPLNTGLIILDEIHKMRGWKTFLKGTFDTRPHGQAILVTGSARLDTFRQTGDSLAGRYHLHRLNPLSVKELAGALPPYEALSALNRLGGFPEPFLSGSDQEASRWRRQYYTDLVREDILDFSRITEIRAIRLLLEMLRRRVGSPLSLTALAGDLQTAPNTIRKYVEILESLHIIFLVRPFHKNIARSLLKEPKAYFYDSGYVDGDEGLRLENTVAVSLLKHAQYLQDSGGADTALHYIRTKDGREVDFALAAGGELTHFIEVKLSEESLSRNLAYFNERHPGRQAVQLVHNLRNDRRAGGAIVAQAGRWLAGLAA
ncbi:MAG: ATP-binding protein [Elusimicrobia bacterium]|nr:ATP-binding protein [Elusimicrobiota bacterium]